MRILTITLLAFLFYTLESLAETPVAKKYIVYNGQRYEITDIYRHNTNPQRTLGIQARNGATTRYFQFSSISAQSTTRFLETILDDNSVDIITSSELFTAGNSTLETTRNWSLAARKNETQYLPTENVPQGAANSPAAFDLDFATYINSTVSRISSSNIRQRFLALEGKLSVSENKIRVLEGQVSTMRSALVKLEGQVEQCNLACNVENSGRNTFPFLYLGPANENTLPSSQKK